MPLAPARLSTTTCWPNAAENFCPTSRAMMSFDPPGANGTMRRMGLEGYAPGAFLACACATPASARPAAAAMRNRIIRFLSDGGFRYRSTGPTLDGVSLSLHLRLRWMVGFAIALPTLRRCAKPRVGWA